MKQYNKNSKLDEYLNDDIINDDIIDENLDEIENIEDDLNSNEELVISDNDEEDDYEEDDVDIMFKFNTNNHKMEGKHSLARDTIFKGKIDENVEQGDYISSSDDFNISDGLPIEAGTSFEFESKFNEEYISRLNLSRDVYDLLKEKTELDFSSNRRKPNKQAFNDYFKMLLNNIGREYTKSEIFVELSYYFTDNIFNMFKLLDKEYATQIIIELKQSGYLSNLNNINFI
jgi:hypothetical protein